MTADELTTQNSALWDVWLDKYVKRLSADISDTADIASADRSRLDIMNATNPRYVHLYLQPTAKLSVVNRLCKLMLRQVFGQFFIVDGISFFT